MKKSIHLKKFAGELKQGISRFVGVFVLSWLLFGVCSLDILSSPTPDWVERVALSVGMGMGFSVFFVLLMEKFQKRWGWVQFLCLVPMVVTFFLCGQTL